MHYASPLVIEPLFNDFDELPDGELRSEVLELAERAGVDVGEVYRVDASRRTTGANAYVAGLGHTKRVVLYDNLIEDFPPAEVRSVVAHELAHVQHDDVPRGLLFLADRAARRCCSFSGWSSGWRPGRAGADLVPALALALAIVGVRRPDRRQLRLARASRRARTRSRSADRRAGGVHRARAAADAAEHLRARAARAAARRCSGPTRRRSSASGYGEAPSGQRSRPRRRAVAELGQVLDALGRLPLREVVLHGVDQLAHEARRQVDARDDDARDSSSSISWSTRAKVIVNS